MLLHLDLLLLVALSVVSAVDIELTELTAPRGAGGVVEPFFVNK